MTKRRQWPKTAEAAREDSLAAAQRIIELLKPLSNMEQMSRLEIGYRASQATVRAQDIQKWLIECKNGIETAQESE